ncbi:MAG: response regulator transcription factor [Actinomycetota bacterium]
MTMREHAYEAPLERTRILLIDDEPRILNFVSRALRGEGFDIETALGGQEGIDSAISSDFDLIILDLRMPVVDGTTVLQRVLARKPDQPVLILSALGDPASKVRALDLGADDYLMKPFSLSELVARVRARVRAAARGIPSHLSAGTLRLDVHRREVDAGAGPIPLAEREFLVLEELMKHAGRTVSKEALLSSVWGYHFDPTSNVLDVTIRRLRTKLGGSSITTVRGVGYRVDVG